MLAVHGRLRGFEPSAFVSVVRLSRGASPFRGSPDHFPLRLRRFGFTVPQVVVMAGVATALLGAMALVNVLLLQPRHGWVLLGGMILAGVGLNDRYR